MKPMRQARQAVERRAFSAAGAAALAMGEED
jgi:hypothetical protein